MPWDEYTMRKVDIIYCFWTCTLLLWLLFDYQSLLRIMKIIFFSLTDDAINYLVNWDLIFPHQLFRSEVDEVRRKQASLENKGVAVFTVCCIFTLLVILRLFLDMATSVYRILSVNRTDYSWKFCAVSSSWFLLLFNCIIIIFILTLW